MVLASLLFSLDSTHLYKWHFQTWERCCILSQSSLFPEAREETMETPHYIFTRCFLLVSAAKPGFLSGSSEFPSRLGSVELNLEQEG